MDSLRNVLLAGSALAAGAYVLFSLAHLLVMAALRLRLVALTWIVITGLLLAIGINATTRHFHAMAVWTPLLFSLALSAPISRHLADRLAWSRDRKAARTGWLHMIDTKDWRGHIYRAAAAGGRTRFETFDESLDPWLLHWADNPAKAAVRTAVEPAPEPPAS